MLPSFMLALKLTEAYNDGSKLIENCRDIEDLESPLNMSKPREIFGSSKARDYSAISAVFSELRRSIVTKIN